MGEENGAAEREAGLTNWKRQWDRERTADRLRYSQGSVKWEEVTIYRGLAV